jgi:amino acid transporter
MVDFFFNVCLFFAVMAGVLFVGKMAFLAKHPPEPEKSNPRRKWSLVWVVWLVLASTGFFVIELPALFNEGGGDTLTEHIQYVAGESPVWTIIVAGGVVTFFTWFFHHLFSKDSRIWKYLKNMKIHEKN